MVTKVDNSNRLVDTMSRHSNCLVDNRRRHSNFAGQ